MTNQVATTISAGMAILLVMNVIKAWLEMGPLPKSSSAHDVTIQLLAAVVGIVGFVGHDWLIGALTRASLSDAVAQGALAGIASIGSYHFANASLVTALNLRTPADGGTV